MRRIACMGLLLLGARACTQLPGTVRLDVDGRMIEVRQRGLSEALFGGGWFYDRACEEIAPAAELERAATGATIRSISASETELTGPDGTVTRLYRCSR